MARSLLMSCRSAVLLVLLALLSAEPALARPAARPTANMTCRRVEIRLPDTIVFHGDTGSLRATVTTDLVAGDYTIGYGASSGQFTITPWDSGEVVLEVMLGNPDKPEIARYQACLRSMASPVPLRVVGARAPGSGPDSFADAPDAPPDTPTCAACEAKDLRALAVGERAALLDAAGADGAQTVWADDVAALAATLSGDAATLSGDTVRDTLEAHRERLGVADAPTRNSRESVLDPARKDQWDALKDWERRLWRDFIERHGDTMDVSEPTPDSLAITKDVRFRMALFMSPRYMKDGAREAATALFNDPLFVSTTIAGIGAYLALWLAPEPIFTKATAMIATVGVVVFAGFAASEIIAVAAAWDRLQRDTARAQNLRDIERAAERFGHALGGTSVRVLVALTMIVGAKATPRAPPGSAPMITVSAGARGSAAVAAVPTIEIKVLADGAVMAVPMAMAMNTLTGVAAQSGGRGGAGGGDGSSAGSAGAGPPRPPNGRKPGFKEPEAASWRYQRYVHKAHKAGKAESEILPFKTWKRRHFDPAARGGRPGQPGGPAHKADVERNNGPNKLRIKTIGNRIPDGIGQPGQTVTIRGQKIVPEGQGRVIVESDHLIANGTLPDSAARAQLRDIRKAQPGATLVVTDLANAKAPPLIYPPGTQPPPPGLLRAGQAIRVPYP